MINKEGINMTETKLYDTAPTWDKVIDKLDSLHEEIKNLTDSILESQNKRIELLEKQIKGI